MINELDLARDSTTSAEILTQLAESDRISVVSSIAANPNTPVSLLIKLAEHRSFLVRQEIARNPNTPIEILQKFIDDPVNVVVAALSQHPQLQADIQTAKSPDTNIDRLAKLALSSYPFIRREIAANPNSNFDILKQESSTVFFFDLCAHSSM
jgi:hypothetical protein